MTIRNESSNETVDIVVIGAGASGGAATAWLAESGFKVKCLEQGYWQDSSKYASASEDYEFEMLTNWAPDPNVRQRAEDYPVNDSNSPVT
ncbi:MAG: FAD-binding protein, partial [Chloroflexi bacterium]|nr:FAD-binding protein [Chloroflexota bacterium]